MGGKRDPSAAWQFCRSARVLSVLAPVCSTRSCTAAMLSRPSYARVAMAGRGV